MANADTSNIEDAVVRATHEILTKPDWSANIGICDWLKRRPSHIPQALRVILSRLKHKQLSVQNHTIELLATLMKNCSDVRVHIAQPDFLKAFVSKVPKKIREPNARFVLKTKWSMQEKSQYDRILVLVKTWARELGSHSRGRPFREIYDQLKATGCKFPSLMEKGMEGAGARVSSGMEVSPHTRTETFSGCIFITNSHTHTHTHTNIYVNIQTHSDTTRKYNNSLHDMIYDIVCLPYIIK